MKSIKPGDKIVACGKVEFNFGFKRMTNPIIHTGDNNKIEDVAKIIPLYKDNDKISSS